MRGNGGAVLVPVEGNTYLSVPILDFGSGNDEEDGDSGQRMPWLSGKHNFGDASALTRFVIGIDEALHDYHSSEEAPLSRDSRPFNDPWNEDLFIHHLPIAPPATAAPTDHPAAMRPGPREQTGGVRVNFRAEGLDGPPVPPSIPTTRLGAGLVSLAGLLVAARFSPARFGFASRQSSKPGGPVAAKARRRHQEPAD